VGRLLRDPPTHLGELEVTEVTDLDVGWRGLSPTEGVVLALGESGRVIVRPSGTEPKLKVYLEITPRQMGSLAEQREAAQVLLEALRENLTSLLSS
jgi:phosphomannomutase